VSLLAGARVLVTGASGFIGRALLPVLTAEGADVHGTTRRPAPGQPGVRWWQCDLADEAAARACIAGSRPDYIVHLSSLADGRRDRRLVLPILHSETVAAVNVLELAAERSVRRVLLPASLEEPLAGEAPTSPYAAAKSATHLYARLFRELYEAPVVMARIFMAYGPGQPEWKLIPFTAARMLRGEKIVIESPARQVDWIYIADVVAGLVAVLCAPGIEGEVVDLGSGALTTISTVVRRLHELTGATIAPEFAAGEAARGSRHSRCADVARSAALTGWRPVVALETGLGHTVAALRQQTGMQPVVR